MPPTNQQETKQMNKTFTIEMVELLHTNNYFGQLPDTSEDEQSAIRQHWLQCMAQRGWTLGTPINAEEMFDSACLQSLIETSEFLAGAF
jgi:hypothetical protein